jgi:hypothetical protein
MNQRRKLLPGVELPWARPSMITVTPREPDMGKRIGAMAFGGTLPIGAPASGSPPELIPSSPIEPRRRAHAP